MVTSCAECHVWPVTLYRAAGLMWHRSSWERAAGQGCHTPPGPGQQRELPGGSPALCLCSAISVAASAAEAALATLPCAFILTRGRGEPAVDSSLLRGAGQLIYVNYFFWSMLF